MRIQTINASEVFSLPGQLDVESPVALATAKPLPVRATNNGSRIGRNSLGPIDRCRREILAEALLDGFLGVDDADYEGLVQFTRKLRDHNPGLAVQLLKPLLRTEATPSVHVEQQAVFMLSDMPADMQQAVAQAAQQAAIDVE